MSLDALIQHYSGILEGVGEDLQRDGLLKTPQRAAKAMEFLFANSSLVRVFFPMHFLAFIRFTLQ